ncbi:MAG: 50S ribosomal protein L35 [bacterium]
MYKLKTNSGAKKRFKRTGTGKIKYKRNSLRHRLQQESSKAKRHKREKGYVTSANFKAIDRIIAR